MRLVLRAEGRQQQGRLLLGVARAAADQHTVYSGGVGHFVGSGNAPPPPQVVGDSELVPVRPDAARDENPT